MRRLASTLLGLSAAGVAGTAYSAGYERLAFALRLVDVPCLPAGSPLLRFLHISDVHMTPRQGRKQTWIRHLAGLEPDLVVTTGDNLAHPRAVAAVLAAYHDLLDLPGVFVLGSNDYYAPVVKNPARYLLPSRGGLHPTGTKLSWDALRDAFCARGWLDLDNRLAELTVNGVRLAFAGTDDPHLGYDDLAAVAGPADQAADLAVGVTHAPYLRILDQFTRDGYRLILAGHTHGGQLRLPGFGALVTNCDLDRGRARGLHRHRAGARTSWLHVSAGLGTSPYAPFRFCCRPEVTLLTLLPVDGGSAGRAALG